MTPDQLAATLAQVTAGLVEVAGAGFGSVHVEVQDGRPRLVSVTISMLLPSAASLAQREEETDKIFVGERRTPSTPSTASNEAPAHGKPPIRRSGVSHETGRAA